MLLLSVGNSSIMMLCQQKHCLVGFMFYQNFFERLDLVTLNRDRKLTMYSKRHLGNLMCCTEVHNQAFLPLSVTKRLLLH